MVDETPRLVAVPSIGLLVPGWILVLPKDHVLSFGALGPFEFEATLDELHDISDRWQRIFGPLAWFEHGPSQYDSHVGCGIDHAHMHLVPTATLDLLSGAREVLPWVEFSEVGDPGAVRAPADERLAYLYLRTPDGRSWLASGDGLPSQAFRRVIAHLQGRAEDYDWRRHPRTAELLETIQRARLA